MSRLACIIVLVVLAVAVGGCHRDYNDNDHPASSPSAGSSASGYGHTPANGATASSPARPASTERP